MHSLFLHVFLIIIGGSFGLLCAAGVFTVFVAVGIVPRFAGRTHTADHILLYEEMVTFGAIFGGLVSLYPQYCKVDAILMKGFHEHLAAVRITEQALMSVFGLFAGMFVGCLALAIAEMLDSIPIFTRRINLRWGLGLAVLGMALGKLCGSLFYFIKEIPTY